MPNKKTYDLLTLEETAERLKIGIGTARNRLSRGDPMPPSIKVGRRLLFPVAEFNQWLSKKIKSNDAGINADR